MYTIHYVVVFFCFKQKTAYEMRISDRSSDVCSSDLTVKALRAAGVKVAIFDRNPEAGAKAAADVGALFCECDVLSDESVDAAFAKARAANGQERVLVCCAGGGNAIRTVSRDKATGEIKMFPTDK